MPSGPTAAGPSPARGSPASREMEPKDQPLVVSTLPCVPDGPAAACPQDYLLPAPAAS